MLALRMTINDKKPVVAGAEDLSVLSAMVTLTGKLGRRTVDPGKGEPDMFVRVGGLTSRPGARLDEHLNWTPHIYLKVGDRVVVELVEVARANRVVERRSAGRKTVNEREYYKQLKKEYLKLKGKYEPES
jgi:hypothetical protein